MTVNRQALHTTYCEMNAVKLTYAHYEALILPNHGGNLISFRNTERNFNFIHCPKPADLAEFARRPYIFGIPVLLPPNRYSDGTFSWHGHTYHLPVNEKETNTHLHGFLYDSPWLVEAMGTTEENAYVTLVQKVDRHHPMYEYWPHEFTITVSYFVDANGLRQHVLVKNQGAAPMPCLIGFHTAINAPFSDNTTSEDYRVKLTVGHRWELSHRGLPTGRSVPLNEDEELLRTVGISPFKVPMDNHYTASPQNGQNRMELVDTKNKVTLIYDVGTSFRHWMLWNNEATPGFFCPEPQMSLVNAPNIHSLSDEEKGLFSINPGELWEQTSRLYTVDSIQ